MIQESMQSGAQGVAHLVGCRACGALLRGSTLFVHLRVDRRDSSFSSFSWSVRRIVTQHRSDGTLESKIMCQANLRADGAFSAPLPSGPACAWGVRSVNARWTSRKDGDID